MPATEEGSAEVVSIDITAFGKSNTRGDLAAMIFRGAGLGFAALILAILWWGLVLWIAISITGDGDGLGTVIVIFIALALAFAPIVGIVLWIVAGTDRFAAGVGTLISTERFDDAALAREVPHIGVTLRELITRVRAFAGSLGQPVTYRETDPAKLRQTRNDRLGLAGAAIVGFFLFAVMGSGWGALPILLAVAGYPVTLLRARQRLQPTIDRLLAQDRRKPVLLLRSFRDDLLVVRQRIATPAGDLAPKPRRFEQGLAGSLGAFGPLIAIGKPGEDLPQIGAARNYLAENEWQPAVLRWMDEALFIAMIAGATEWIRWELGRILEKGRLRHLLVFLPPKVERERWQNLLTALAGTRWHAALSSLDLEGLMVVQLRPDARVIAIRRKGEPWEEDYRLATAIAIYEEFCGENAGTGGPATSGAPTALP
jgi:hypothetical protein